MKIINSLVQKQKKIFGFLIIYHKIVFLVKQNSLLFLIDVTIVGYVEIFFVIIVQIDKFNLLSKIKKDMKKLLKLKYVTIVLIYV